MKTILTSFARNTVFANIVLVIIFVSGTLTTTLMTKETFPEFSLDMISISVLYPGADPEEVEEGICRKIEEAVESVEGIKQYTLKASENLATASLEVQEDFSVERVLNDVKSSIDAISTFPPDAEKPVIKEIIRKDTVSMLYLSGHMSERQLKEWAEDIRDELQQLPEISQVEIFGARDYEINIEVSEERLREYGLSLGQVARAVRQSNLNQSGGLIRSKGEEIRIRTIGRKYTGKELASIVVLARPNGEIITLDRIASIKDDFSEDPVYAAVDDMPAVLVLVSKTSEEDSLAIARAVTRFVATKHAILPEGANLALLFDGTDALKSRIRLLIKNGVIGLGFVFLLLWLFLDLRLSFWGGLGIPVSLAGAMVLLWAQGGTINMISLFAMIMVLGIVVDDAIVVGESIYVHRKNGQPPLQAAVEGVYEVGMPVFAAVVTTVVAFIPLAYVGGIMGKFIAILPMVVISCLVVSLIECLILLPAHLSHLPDLNRPRTPKNRLLAAISSVHRRTNAGLENFISAYYVPAIRRIVQWRYVGFCTAISLLMLTVGLVQSGIIKFEVMPEIDGYIVTVDLQFPNGTPAEVTQAALQQVDDALLRLNETTDTASGDPLLKHRLTLVGQTLGGNMSSSGSHVGSMRAIFLESEKRGIHSKDLIVKWEKEVGEIAGIEAISFEGMAAGPPGAPIEIWLQGKDMGQILAATDDLKEKLKEFAGVYQIRSDFSPGKNELRFSLKPEAHTLGLTVDELASQLYNGYYGNEAVRLQRGRDDIKVKVRYTADERSRLSELNRIRIRTPEGHYVPLMSVADVSYGPGYATITRTDGLRRVSVSAAVDTNKANANEIFAELSHGYFKELQHTYPGVWVALQGEKKKMRESLGSLFVGFPMAILGIFVIIATIFRSYSQPFVILFTIPFGIIGAIIGHLVLGYTLSMMSMFGMVALTGVVINDAIVLIERINNNLAEKMDFFEAIVRGGARRFRAIFLTSASTVGGLLPLILETDLQARFLIPMALSIAGGVLFATVLTLVVIPCLLVILNDLRRVKYRFARGEWPSREEVEPGTHRTSLPAG